VAASLFVRSLSRLESIQLGFNRENVLTFRLDASRAGHSDAEVPALYSGLRARFAAIPGVRSATLSENKLMGGRVFSPVSAAGGKAKTCFVWAV